MVAAILFLLIASHGNSAVSGSAAHVICPGNLTALKPPLGVQWRIHWQCYSKHILQDLCELTQTVRTYTDCANLHRLCEPTQTVWTYRLCEPTQTVWTYTDCEPTDCVNLHRLCEPTDCVNLHRLCEPTQTVWTYTNCVNLQRCVECKKVTELLKWSHLVEQSLNLQDCLRSEFAAAGSH